MLQDKHIYHFYILMVFYLDLCWGKLEDYEAQDLDPPIVEAQKFAPFSADHRLQKLMAERAQNNLMREAANQYQPSNMTFNPHAIKNITPLSADQIMKKLIAKRLQENVQGAPNSPIEQDKKLTLAQKFATPMSADKILRKLMAKRAKDNGEVYYGETTPRVNKHLYKSEGIVTHRYTVYPSDPPLVLCRCWESKKFPLCDGAHRAHNERNQDNIGPAIVVGSKDLNFEHSMWRYNQSKLKEAGGTKDTTCSTPHTLPGKDDLMFPEV